MSIAASRLLELRIYNERYASAITRRLSNYGCIEAFEKDNDSPFQILTNAQRRLIAENMGRDINLMGWNSDSITINSARACTITDFESSNAYYTVVPLTYSFDVSMAPSQYKQNELDYMQDFNNKIWLGARALRAQMEADALAVLTLRRNQVWTPAPPYTVNASDYLEVPALVQNDFYNNLPAVFDSLDYGDTMGAIRVISSPYGVPLVSRLSNQGSNNGINEQFQLSDIDFMKSNFMTVPATFTSYGIAVKEGMLSSVKMIDPDAMAGGYEFAHKADDAAWGLYDVPLVGQMGVLYKANCGDFTVTDPTLAHLTATKLEKWQFSMDLALVVAYNDDDVNNANPIIHFAIGS